LNAVLAQSLPAPCFEVIVIDDGGEAGTACELVQSMAKQLPDGPVLRCASTQRRRGPAAARNLGWHMAVGEVIAFTDDDTIPAPDWLLGGLGALRPGMAAVSGRVIVPTRGPLTDFERMTKGLEHGEFVTANAFVRRSTLFHLGGFDERFRRAWREDSDLQFRILAAGGRIGRAEGAIVKHPVRSVSWGVSLGQQRNVFFDALLFKKHRELYRLKIRPQPPWHYYLIVLFTLLAIVALFDGQLAWAVCAALLAMALIVRFAWQRLRHASRSLHHVVEMVVTSMVIPFLSVFWRLAGAWRFRVLFL
jgi:glycosyltransferase involved in cell wall biosynthesis